MLLLACFTCAAEVIWFIMMATIRLVSKTVQILQCELFRDKKNVFVYAQNLQTWKVWSQVMIVDDSQLIMNNHRPSSTTIHFEHVQILYGDVFSLLTTRMTVDVSFLLSCFLHQNSLESFFVSSPNN